MTSTERGKAGVDAALGWAAIGLVALFTGGIKAPPTSSIRTLTDDELRQVRGGGPGVLGPGAPVAPSIVGDAVANPQALWGKSAEDIAAAFNNAGFPAVVRQSGKGSKLAKIVEINGHKEIAQIQIHPGGGRHGGAYVKLSTNKGIVKVVDRATYKPSPGEKATILDKPPL